MSSQRMIKDSFWTDSYIADLDPTEKLLFLYLLTNPLCNIAGIYEIQSRRIAFDTGIDKDMVDKVLQRFAKDGKIIRYGDWLLMVNHAKHQMYKNDNVSKGISRIISNLPQKVKALKGFERLSHLTLLNSTLLIGEANASQKLPTNSEKDMAWTPRASDNDDDLPAIDMDSGEELKQKRKPTKKYPNAPAVRKLFLQVLGTSPANWKVNAAQLQACENLYTERTLEKIESALLFYKEHEDDEFCPKITSPYDLDSKWTKLGAYKLKIEK